MTVANTNNATINAIVELIKEQVPDAEVRATEAIKNNETLTGITIIPVGSNVGPTIYPDKDLSIEENVSTIIDTYKKTSDRRDKFSDVVNTIDTFDKVKDKLTLKLVSRENEKLLEDAVYEEFLDIAAVLYINVDSDEHSIATIKANEKLLEMWGVTEEDAIETAKGNFGEPVIEDMLEMIAQMIGEDVEELRRKNS